MNYDQFKIGFWHPFGPHGKETPEDILTRKSREIYLNGWTLWSFQHRLMHGEWRRKIREAGDPPVYVFCSDSKTTEDPADNDSALDSQPRRTQYCTEYKIIDQPDWQVIPKEKVAVPHPFRPNEREVSAFVVQKIFYPVENFTLPAVEWYSKDGLWDSRKVSTRGETMIRPGGSIRMRPVRAVLELKAPDYLALVRN